MAAAGILALPLMRRSTGALTQQSGKVMMDEWMENDPITLFIFLFLSLSLVLCSLLLLLLLVLL